MNRKLKAIIVSIFFLSCMFFSLQNIMGVIFNASPFDEPEYGSWNVSEHIRGPNGDEPNWVFMHPESWNFIEDTLVSNSTGDLEFSAAIVNDSWANRTQSLLWANFTRTTDDDCIFIGPIYACRDNGTFDMALYGASYLFLLTWNGTNLTNTADRTLVEHELDAINYFNSKYGMYYANGAFGNGIFIKTIYNSLCGGLFTKYWGTDLTLMYEPTGWNYEGNVSGKIQTNNPVRWGVAWWGPHISESFTVDFDFMNMWRLNYSTTYDETFIPSDYRPFMNFPIVNLSEENTGNDAITFMMDHFMGTNNITNDTTATFLRDNITEKMSLESRMYHPNSSGVYSQNDTVYYYGATLTNLADYILDTWGGDVSWVPNNVLWLYVQNCPDGEEDFAGFDYIFVAIDTENDGIWDSTDRAFYVDEVVQASWTGTTPDADPYDEFMGFGSGGGYWSNSYPYLHRYSNHLAYWLMIPLDWLVNDKTGENLDIGDAFGLHIQTSSTDDDNLCVWENWNESSCSSFVDEGNLSVLDIYMNNTDIYDEEEDEPLDLTINETALGYWGGGAITGDGPLPPDFRDYSEEEREETLDCVDLSDSDSLEDYGISYYSKVWHEVRYVLRTEDMINDDIVKVQIPETITKYFFFGLFESYETVSSVIVYGVTIDDYSKILLTTTVGEDNKYTFKVKDLENYDIICIIPNPSYLDTSNWLFNWLYKNDILSIS